MNISLETLLFQSHLADCSHDLQKIWADRTSKLGPHLGDIRILCAALSFTRSLRGHPL